MIPGYGVKGPILSPAKYDVHQILKWINAGIDVREVMEDGSYRKLNINDPRLMELLNEKVNKKVDQRKQERQLSNNDNIVKPQGNVRLKPEKIHDPKPKKVQPKPVKEVIKEEPKKIEVKEEVADLFIDELEKPE
jgi:hypothetical protein